jgi:hypothetical protein
MDDGLGGQFPKDVRVKGGNVRTGWVPVPCVGDDQMPPNG